MPRMLCPWGARRIWKLYASPFTLHPLLRDAAVSLCLLYYFADMEPHSGHMFWLSEYLHREHLYILPLPSPTCVYVP